MAQKVFSVKMDEEHVAALELLAEQQNTSRNALICEAVKSILGGGMDQVLEQKVTRCLEHVLGFNNKDGFNEAVEAKFGSMLVDLIDARLKVLFSVDMAEDLQSGSLAALVSAQRPGPKTISKVTVRSALDWLDNRLANDIPVSLDELAEFSQADKQILAKTLSDLGVKTERKRVGGGERAMYYLPDKRAAVQKALEA